MLTSCPVCIDNQILVDVHSMVSLSFHATIDSPRARISACLSLDLTLFLGVYKGTGVAELRRKERLLLLRFH